MKLKKAEKYWSDKGHVFAGVSVFAIPGNAPRIKKAPKKNTIVDPKAVTEECRLKEATEKLRAAAKGVEVVDVPEGDPMFLFSFAVGKTRPINIFYDKGCSHIVFKHGIPKNEIDGEITERGPLTIKGINDTRVTARDQWACLLDRIDGTKQVVHGLSVDKITATFPKIDVSAAVKEVKEDAPDNAELQDLRIPQFVGGDPDILIGIHYENCHPVKVHTLPSGLFIAKLQLAAYEGYTGVIGGPHKTFKVLADQAGGTVNLMSHFVSGLQQYKDLGAPKIHAPMMTYEDVHFAHKVNKAEIIELAGSLEGFFDNENVEETILIDSSEPADLKVTTEDQHSVYGTGTKATDFHFVDVNSTKDSNFFDSSNKTSLDLSCSYCGSVAEEDISEELDYYYGLVSKLKKKEDVPIASPLVEDDKLRELKFIAKMQESGISLEYRCTRCRSCSDCRNAPDTERISAREEAEDQAIKDSVKIDFANKRIECTLPLRAKEEDYLSTNRETALKVLNAQCKKLKNDQEAKEVVIKSFQKLFDGKFARRFDELDGEHQKLILSKEVQHYLPWRCVYKESISTPCRCVMDASSKTPLLPNGKGGRCLNDLCMKGSVNTLDLLNMLLRFSVGEAACAGDLKQFYPSINLHPSQWNLQRVLWRENMDMDAVTLEIIITVLIYGVRSVSALSEKAVILLAGYVKDKNPLLAALLLWSRFVDDLADSGKSVGAMEELTKSADELFQSVGWSCKGWSVSTKPPHPDVTKDGISVDVGGLVWYPVIDCISVRIPPLHFGVKKRGKLMVGTEIFDGSFEDLKKFCPKRFTRRTIVSKFWAVFDIFGLLTPLTASIKVDVSRAIKETDGWDAEVPVDVHDKCLQNLWKLHKLRGVKFRRAKVPVDAIDSNMHVYCCVDAAGKLKIIGVWARFKRKNGRWSCQLLIGRSILTKEGTIPMEELEALMIGSNLLWIVRKALASWISDFFLFGDSVISICWTISEKKRLSLFHRNRCNQIRMNTQLDRIYHVKTDFNPSDIGTRPEKLQECDVGPDSVWMKGHEWMTEDLKAAIVQDIVTPAAKLKLKDDEKYEFSKGLVHERIPEILVKGHFAFVNDRVSKLTSRAVFSNYILSPTKYPFSKCVRIVARIMKMFQTKRQIYNPGKLHKLHNFRIFSVMCKNGNVESNEADVVFVDSPTSVESISLVDGSKFFDTELFKALVADVEKAGGAKTIDDEDISDALAYWFLKGTQEVKKFNKKELIDKIAIEKNNILFNRSRILDGQRFVLTGGFKEDSLGMEVQLNLMSPILDRHSPIALSIALYIHEKLAMHAGYETCYRMSLGFCHIIQGLSLFEQSRKNVPNVLV